MDRWVTVQGRRLAALRTQQYLTQDEFAERLQMSAGNLRRLEQLEVSRMRLANFRRLAEVLKLAPDELRRRIGMPAQQSEGEPLDAPQPAGFAGAPKEVVDVEQYHGVSAARLEERSGESRDKSPVPAGPAQRFAVTVDGDCMEPAYRDGDVVIFSVDAVEREGIIDGKNYFVQLKDGENTFKRVFLDAERADLLILRCWNERYPARTIQRRDVKLLARAVYRLVPDR